MMKSMMVVVTMSFLIVPSLAGAETIILTSFIQKPDGSKQVTGTVAHTGPNARAICEQRKQIAPKPANETLACLTPQQLAEIAK